jgi:3-oxoacyl-[acyl-carrier protein] reductase
MAGAALAPLAVMPALAQEVRSPQPARSNGKVAIITGSSRGIGAAVAKRLAHDGFKVTVNGVRNNALGETIVDEIKSSGGEAI